MRTAKNTTRPNCPSCQVAGIRWGKDRDGHQRYRCRSCGKTYATRPARPLGSMRLSVEKASLCLRVLVEGGSIRGTERITGVHRDTICRLIRQVGGKCEALLAEMVQGVEVGRVEMDETWTFCGMKQRTKTLRGIKDPRVGDQYAFLAVDPDSKMVLTWELGRRSIQTTDAFVERLSKAVDGRFQLSSDGWAAYPSTVGYHLGMRVDYGVTIKEFRSEGPEALRRYSPPRLISATKTVIQGQPDEDKTSTSIVERMNLSVRTHLKRMSRLTCAFSRKFENLRAMLAIYLLHFNTVRFHRSLGMTPAMKAGVTRAPWSMRELLTA